jgi:leader peptidase (prepilin peptidase)/N-methyltransferase
MDTLNALNQHPWLLQASLLALGLVVGSFLNVVIYRLPVMIERDERNYCAELLETDIGEPESEPFDLIQPNSHCPHCNHAIRPWENIPVISYVLLRGRCSNCAASISLRYPLIEVATGLLTLSLGWHYGMAGMVLFGTLLFTWALIALTMIDIDHMLLPDGITLPLIWLGLLFNISGTYVPLQDAVLGAIAGYLSLWCVYWLFKLATGKEGMGFGDFKLLAALGAWLGWQALPMVILLSSLVGAVLGTIAMLLAKRGKDIPIPFGPYLAIAGWIALIWGTELMAWYWSAMVPGQTP